MRAPFASDSTELCPDDKDIHNSDDVSEIAIHSVQSPLERNRWKRAVFGICLDDLMGTTKHVVPQIPFILSRLCKYLEKYGLHQRNLFLEGEEKAIVEALKAGFAECGDAPLEKVVSISSVAKLLIVFFEDLQEPLISESTQNDLIQGMEMLSLHSNGCIPELKSILEKLPCSSYQVLKYLSRFLLKVSSHQEDNGMTTNSLAIIFVPVLFRPLSSDPKILLKLKKIMSCIVDEYYAIFENALSNGTQNVHKLLQQTPSPCVMPIISLTPLSVDIPPMNADAIEDIKKTNIPILLIEGINSKNEDSCKIASIKASPGTISTRKRKERRFSGEEPPQRSSSEERPLSSTSTTLEQIECIRRCSSHEYVPGLSEDNQNAVDSSSSISSSSSSDADTYLSTTVEDISDKNLSPHPPHAKRREMDINHFHKEEDSAFRRSRSSSHFSSRSSHISNVGLTLPSLDRNQNSFAETYRNKTRLSDENMDEDSFDTGEVEMENDDIQDSKAEDDTSESESSSLSLSWSMLFEDSEPIRAAHPINWSPEKDDHIDEGALLSPSVEKLKNSNFYEAPLSPSAFKSYLSHRSSHFDASVPPSPPVEQEDFAKKLVEVNSTSDSIKKLTKSIHGIKRKIRKFDEKFETEFGYKPSHAEKSNSSEAKKLLTDLYKARKELKVLKEETHLDHVSTSNSWHASRYSHILGDSTNQFLKDGQKKSKPLIKDLFSQTIKSLAEERNTVHRPDNVEDMTTDEVRDEKLAIQKALLNFESIHGRPIPKEERSIIRPLYERYRSVKKILVRSGSFTGTGNDLCGELTPILEHETMDFPTREYRAEKVSETDVKSEDKPPVEQAYAGDDSKNSSNFTAMKYDSSNLHELPLSEMIFQMQKVKSERRHLHKIIREFELEFARLNGRKPSKEDKMPLKSVYHEHKHIKGRQRLLEALITKHDQHQLM